MASENVTMSPHIKLDMDRIKEFCERWKISEIALFGSVLRDDFRPDSDVDVLITFGPDSKVSLFDLSEIEDELTDIIGRKADLTMRRGIERSSNRIRRKAILSSAEVIYGA
jgi:hypothetical protein